MPVVNNFYDNFYISGVQLTTSNNYGRNDETNILINNNNLTNLGTSAYYYYGKKTGTEQGQNYFYYPLYANNTGGNEGISFVNIDYTFYTPDTTGYQLGPPSLGIKNLNIELGTVEIKLKYPDFPVEGISFFPTGFNIVSPGISYDGSNSFSSIDNGFTVNLQPLSDNKNTFFASLLRSKSLTLSETQTNNQGEKIKSYLDALDNVITLNNLESKNVNLTIYPEKNYILTADYDVFLSPYKIDSTGKINRLCYDENNKQLPRGTTTTLKSDETVYYNNKCSDYNIEGKKTALCGNYVLEDKSSCVQSIQDRNPRFMETCTALNVKNTYFNNKGFLEEGLFQENVLTCDSEDCFPLKYTQEANTSLTNYELNDEAYLNLQKKDYYVSNVNNNDFDPLNPLYWTRVFPYIQGENVKIGQKFFIKPQDQDTIYIYECIEEGVAPYGIENLSIDFDYLKQQPVYTTFENTGLDVLSYSSGNPKGFFSSLTGEVTSLSGDTTFYSYVLASQFPFTNTYQKILNTIKDVSLIVYSQSLNNITVDVEVKNSGGQVGDVYNPTFSFWSLFINFIYSGAVAPTLIPTEKFILGSIINNSNSEVSFTSFGENKISQGDYVALIPSEQNTGGVKGIEAINLITNYIKVNSSSGKTTTIPNNKFLGEFEVANVLQVSGNNLKLKRNVLNSPSENLFTNTDQALTNVYRDLNLFYIPPEFITLQYQFTSKDKFTINSSVNSNLGISPGSFFTPTGGTCFVISANEKVGVGFTFQNFYNSKIISNNIVYPSINTDNGIYYIANNNSSSQLYNTVTEIYYENNNYYFKEYKENQEEVSAFAKNDVLVIQLNDNKYRFKIIQLNSYTNDKIYDYKCVSVLHPTTNFKEDFQTTYEYKENTNVISGYNLFVPSVVSNLHDNYTYFVYETGNNSDSKIYLVDGNSTKPGPSFIFVE